MNSSLNILYVEDCEVSVELFKLSLDRFCAIDNLVLDIAATVSSAIELFAPEKHVAAFIDWNLPDGGGTEVAQHIRGLNDTLPIIFLSAAFTDDHLHEAEKYRPKDCLLKSHSREFVYKITRHIPKR